MPNLFRISIITKNENGMTKNSITMTDLAS